MYAVARQVSATRDVFTRFDWFLSSPWRNLIGRECLSGMQRICENLVEKNCCEEKITQQEKMCGGDREFSRKYKFQERP